jgi:hypothetical protein
MKLAFTLHTLVLVFYAFVLLFIPASYLALYGVSFAAGAAVVIRFTGALAAGNALLSWLARDMPWADGLKAIALSFFIDWVLILIIGLLGQFAGAMNALGWTTVVMAAIWAGVFGYFRFMKA